jgi:Domain of unknown function (DUF5615)
MAAFYSDEDIPASLANALSVLGHSIRSAEADGRPNRGIDDADVLARATALGRAVLTFNRWDYHRLHTTDPHHAGIVTCTDDPDRTALAQRIDHAVRQVARLDGCLVKVIQPNRP